MSKKRLVPSPPATPPDPAVDDLYQSIKQLVEQARAQVVVQVNQALVLTYWHIGKTIKQSVITEARADYGDATMQKLADKLVLDYGPGFGRRNLFRMVQLYQCFGSLEIVTTLSAQLSWSHLVELMDLEPDHIHVAEYWLQLPPQEVLRAKLHKALVEARARLELQRRAADEE
jgi:hypothetical protein